MAHQDDQQPGTSSNAYSEIIGHVDEEINDVKTSEKKISVETLLKEFTKYFVQTFEKKLKNYNEEADIGGKEKDGKTMIGLVNPVAGVADSIGNKFIPSPVKLPIKDTIQASAALTNNHRKKAKRIVNVLRESNKNDLRKILVVGAGDIFYSFQNQITNVTDVDGCPIRAMHKLADDAVDRIMNYIDKSKKENISKECIVSNLITKGLIIGESKKTLGDANFLKFFYNIGRNIRKTKYGRSIKEGNSSGLTTTTFYTRPIILKIGPDRKIQLFARIGKKDSLNEFCYRFTFEWERLEDYKLLKNHKEITPEFIITKEELEENLESILESINSDDPSLTMKAMKDDTTFIRNNIIGINTNEMYNNIEEILENQELLKRMVNEGLQKNNTVQTSEVKNNSVWFEMMEPVKTFTGRIDVLKKLYDALHDTSGSAVISQTISGLGGIGKSELARKYAYEYHKEYDNVIWINSEFYANLKESFVRLAKRLSIPTKENNEEREIASIIADIYMRFSLGKCLFIFDNAEDYKIIKEFLPLSLSPTIQRPHILLTSRSQNWELPDAMTMTVINLEYFTEEEAINYLKVALTNSTEESLNDDDIKNLVIVLGYFPLALGQAVAYIKKTNARTKIFGKGPFKISDYIKLYQDELNKSKLLGHRHDLSPYNKTILTTWNITLNKIKKENKNSIKIIEIMSYLVPDSINADRMFKELITDEEKRQDAIDLLLNYSMINIKDQVLSIHRLVQEVIRLQIKRKGKETDVLKNALELLGFNIPDVDNIHLISVWIYACDYGEIIDEFFFKYNYGDKKTTPLNLIVESGNIDAVNKILNHLKKKSKKKLQEILNSKQFPYDTPLEISIQQNNLEMAKLLIGFGAEKNSIICVKTIFYGPVDMVKCIYPNNDEYLLHAKFYSALISGNVESVNNLLKDLENEQIKNLMEQKITNVDPKLKNKQPPLYLAARSGNLEIVKLLVINYGADTNLSCVWGTSLDAAVDNGHYEMFEFLIENGANYNEVNSYGWTVLHKAAFFGHLEIVKYLIENNKCDINATDKKGWTALHLATEYYYYATKEKKLEIVEYLTKKLNERKLI